MTETQKTGFPLSWEWRILGFWFCFSVFVGMMKFWVLGIYRKKQKPLCRHSRAGGNLDLRTTVIFKDYLKVRDSGFPLSWEWRDFRFLILVFCFCRNDEILSFRNLPEKTETVLSSFPRRRESRHSMLRQFIGNDWNSKNWIPTSVGMMGCRFVGMTWCRFVGMTWCRFPYGWIRHSRAVGNLDIQC